MDSSRFEECPRCQEFGGCCCRVEVLEHRLSNGLWVESQLVVGHGRRILGFCG